MPTKPEPPKKNTFLKILLVFILLWWVGSLMRSKPEPPAVPKVQAEQTEKAEAVAEAKPKGDIFDTKPPAAPAGDAATVALAAIRFTRTPCESLEGAARRDDGSIYAGCKMGGYSSESYKIFTERINSELRISVMTCRAARLQGLGC